MTMTVTTEICRNGECEAEFEVPADIDACPECQTEFCACQTPGVPCPYHNGERDEF